VLDKYYFSDQMTCVISYSERKRAVALVFRTHPLGKACARSRDQAAFLIGIRSFRHSTAVALVMVALLLAFTLSACGQPRASAAQDVASSMTNHMARVTPQVQATWQVKASPVRLSIPAIGVNAPIERVGITSTGDLAIPAQKPWEDAGWYASGPLPGELGSAVIDGHLDRPGGYPAVFWRLRDLHVGNEVVVVDTQGETQHFRVTAIAYYAPQSAPIQEIFANQSGKYLNLITCAGDWIPSQHQTTLRLVVYTSLE
jgi:sortase (surface protein transpeptidase)